MHDGSQQPCQPNIGVGIIANSIPLWSLYFINPPPKKKQKEVFKGPYVSWSCSGGAGASPTSKADSLGAIG